MNAAEIARGLGLRRSGAAYGGPCPACGYRGFQVHDVNGVALVKCHAGGCDQQRVLSALRGAGLWQARWISCDRRVSRAPEARGAREPFHSIWSRTLPAQRSPVEGYLRARGHRGAIPADICFLANAKHTETGTSWPAMVAAVRRVDDAEPVAVHRTYLDRSGRAKAPVEPNKKTLGPTAGGAVRLAEAGVEIAVAEGIETGLAVLATTGVSTWAALSAGGIRGLILPPLPLAATVTICADHDPVGRGAAHAAAERWHREGRRVRIAMPSEPGLDFDDLARATETAS